jgi:serine/threonine-protein phosphatase 2B catalytic subunit
METLKDPINDRFLQNLTPPPIGYLPHDLLYPPGSKKPSLEILKDHLKKEGKLHKNDCIQLITEASALLSSEANLLHLSEPIVIIGDIHGQYYDFLKIIELAGPPKANKYLFLGDYVDRGSFSLEVVLVLYSLKLNFPNSVYLLRGNHESRQLTSFFNFRSEVLSKYDLELYEVIMNSFDCIPLACIVNQKFFCVHGGISPSLRFLKELPNIDRKCEIPNKGGFCDLLWSDPIDTEVGTSPEKFRHNTVRDCSFFYSVTAANEFLKENRLLCIVRAHEAQIDGYKMHKWNGNSEFPVVITVFSAPNYCDVYNNKGAFLRLSNNGLNIQQYNYTMHPYILPNFMDAFTWSVPFVIEKVLQLIWSTIPKSDEDSDTLGDGLRDLQNQFKENKSDMLKKKLRAVTSMMKMFNTLRSDNESILMLKGMCPDNKIPRGLLVQGHEAIVGAIQSFNHAKNLDKENEKRPSG